MKKKIAFISDHASPLATLGGVDSGGQNVYVAEVARCLGQNGEHVDIFTRREDTTTADIFDFAPNVRVIQVEAGPPIILPKEELYVHMQEFAAQVLRFIGDQSITYDLVHAHFWLSGMVAMEIKQQLGIPFVITFHALGKVRRLHQGEDDKFPVQRERIEQDIMWRADKIIAECPNDVKDLMQLYHAPQEKLEIIPCGFSPKDFHPVPKEEAIQHLGLSADCDYLLQLGRIVPRKGIDDVIRAFGNIHHSAPRLRLLIVGGDLEKIDSNSELQRLRELASHSGVGEKVIFVGQQSRDRLKYYYSASEIFVTTPWYEPFGITPLEAMACGTPVIGSDVGGVSYTVRHGKTGLLVPPRSPQKLAEALITLYSDESRRKEMKQYALPYVKNKFTWGAISDQIQELYDQLIPICQQHKILQQLKDNFQQASQTLLRSSEVLPHQIAKVAQEICKVLLTGNKVMVCGRADRSV